MENTHTHIYIYIYICVNKQSFAYAFEFKLHTSRQGPEPIQAKRDLPHQSKPVKRKSCTTYITQLEQCFANLVNSLTPPSRPENQHSLEEVCPIGGGVLVAPRHY